MKVTLKEYEPMRGGILLKVKKKTQSEGGLILPKAVKERWMEVVKKADNVHSVEVGEMVLIGDGMPPIGLTFGDEEYVQVTEHNLVGKVKPVGFAADVKHITTTLT